jgi:heterodisulfide reductase subunit A
MPDESRIGVFICHCGGNISDYVEVARLRDAVAREPGVVVARTHMFTCSDAAQQEMIEDIKKENLNGLVIASCSPKLHMFTFRGMAQRAGMNPYQYVQVNLREQCSWAHTDDRRGATQKGISLVRAGIAKCRGTRPLKPFRIDTAPGVLVIGAGVAGLRAALSLSDMGLNVCLIEKAEQAGGWTAQLGKLYPHDRDGRDLTARLLAGVRERDNIILFTDAELVEKRGSVGDFHLTVRTGGHTVPLHVGAIIVATGFDAYRPADGEYGYGLPGVLTLPEFRRMIDRSEGELTYNGKPVGDVAYIYCVGSRQAAGESDTPHPYCSRYCCSAGVHTALLVQEQAAGARQYHVFRDMRTYGKNEVIYAAARDRGSVFLRPKDGTRPEIERTPRGLAVKVADELTGGQEIEIDVDLVVLVTGMVPRENKRLTDILKLPVDRNGFFNEIHLKLRPVETVVDGVFLAGACQSPKTVAESVASSLAAVSKSAALLMRGHVELDPLIARIDPERCTWCEACAAACPYEAVEQGQVDGRPAARIVASLCKGEGGCVPVCPQNAIEIEGYTNAQVTGMIEALAREVA